MNDLPVLPNNPFKHVRVDFKVSGASRVTWEIERHFYGVQPYSFQLQWSLSGIPEADAWELLGSPATNVFTLSDSEARKLGKLNKVHYRVQLTDANDDVWYSEPAATEGSLDQREWLLARELVFRETLLNSRLHGTEGYLLKLRAQGEPCPDCLDPFTGQVMDSKCPTCHGTRFIDGYFTALPLYMTLVDAGSYRENRGNERSTVGDNNIVGRFVGTPQICSYDVWVDKDSDERYYFHTIKTIASIRSVPLAYQVELRQAAVDDAVYSIQVP